MVITNIINNVITCFLSNGTTANFNKDDLVKIDDILSQISLQKRPEKKDTKIDL